MSRRTVMRAVLFLFKVVVLANVIYLVFMAGRESGIQRAITVWDNSNAWIRSGRMDTLTEAEFNNTNSTNSTTKNESN